MSADWTRFHSEFDGGKSLLNTQQPQAVDRSGRQSTQLADFRALFVVNRVTYRQVLRWRGKSEGHQSFANDSRVVGSGRQLLAQVAAFVEADSVKVVAVALEGEGRSRRQVSSPFPDTQAVPEPAVLVFMDAGECFIKKILAAHNPPAQLLHPRVSRNDEVPLLECRGLLKEGPDAEITSRADGNLLPDAIHGEVLQKGTLAFIVTLDKKVTR